MDLCIYPGCELGRRDAFFQENVSVFARIAGHHHGERIAGTIVEIESVDVCDGGVVGGSDPRLIGCDDVRIQLIAFDGERIDDRQVAEVLDLIDTRILAGIIEAWARRLMIEN